MGEPSRDVAVLRPVISREFTTDLTPDGQPVTVRIACRLNRGPAKHHMVTVHSGGRVDSPHDLDLEEIAQRLGGGPPPPCLTFAREVVPIVLNELPIILRRERPAITISPQGKIRHLDSIGCCRKTSVINHHQQIKNVCAHVRTLEHLHLKYSNDNYLIGMLLDQISRAWNGLHTPPVDEWGASAYLPKGQTLQDWWEMGIHPQDVPMLAEAYTEPGGQIPLFGHDIVRSAFPTPYEPSPDEAEELLRELLLDVPAAPGPSEPWAVGF